MQEEPMSIGIEDISFYTPSSYLPLTTLAKHYGTDKNKYLLGIGQRKMSVPCFDEDIVTLAANAAFPLINEKNVSTISTVLFATESSIDQSKAAGIYLHTLLNLKTNCRIVELKQACYSGTAALQIACSLVATDQSQSVLVVASDIARYKQGSPGEATQGCGAVAMLVKKDPKLIQLNTKTGYYTEDVMDFWRPNHMDTALVDGKYSTLIYLKTLKYAWKHYQLKNSILFSDISRFCYHIPFTRMGVKAHKKLALYTGTNLSQTQINLQIKSSLLYSQDIGNSYTASLYIALASLLDNDEADLSASIVGFFSYGSGCVGEFFSGVVCDGYKKYLRTQHHQHLISDRSSLSYSEYEARFYYSEPKGQSDFIFPKMTNGRFRLAAVEDNKRIYSET